MHDQHKMSLLVLNNNTDLVNEILIENMKNQNKKRENAEHNILH